MATEGISVISKTPPKADSSVEKNKLISRLPLRKKPRGAFLYCCGSQMCHLVFSHHSMQPRFKQAQRELVLWADLGVMHKLLAFQAYKTQELRCR